MMTENTSPPQPETAIDEETLVIPEEEIRAEIDDSPREDKMVFKRSHVYAALLPLAFVVGLSVGYLFWGRPSEQAAAPEVAAEQQAEPEAQAEPSQPQQVKRYDIPEDDDPVWGPDDAEITIIEFSDYECGYCRKWHTETWPQIKDAYEGRVRLVYRDYPLTQIHGNAVPAAAAANCAGEQDAYWEYNEKLFSRDANLNMNGYRTYAEELSLDMDAFEECIESGRQTEEVEADQLYAMQRGIQSTPTFFLNGIPIVGAQPFNVFEQIIEKELAGEIP